MPHRSKVRRQRGSTKGAGIFSPIRHLYSSLTGTPVQMTTQIRDNQGVTSYEFSGISKNNQITIVNPYSVREVTTFTNIGAVDPRKIMYIVTPNNPAPVMINPGIPNMFQTVPVTFRFLNRLLALRGVSPYGPYVSPVPMGQVPMGQVPMVQQSFGGRKKRRVSRRRRSSRV